VVSTVIPENFKVLYLGW